MIIVNEKNSSKKEYCKNCEQEGNFYIWRAVLFKIELNIDETHFLLYY